ncbi:MAG TPA: hypothetical protein VGY55_11410 [Pirellulales bacterium]|jgi:hypothetical protein|nr:hypothetical protein [Pirellulales bacterium]
MDEQRELAPPWVEFPYIPWLSNGWAMGPAGFYWWRWEAWFRALSESARNDYKSKYPEPKGWPGFYGLKEPGERPDIVEIVKEYGEIEVINAEEYFETASNADYVLFCDDEAALRGPLGRLVILLLREAVARQFKEIEIDICGNVCPIHLVRGDERFKMDPLPKRLYRRFSRQVARMCGNEDCQGQGTFSASLDTDAPNAEPYGEVKVSVVFGESSLRLTIIERQGAAP